jgi:phage shock protein C
MFSRKYKGYGMDLYRSRNDSWMAGVCGGIAENMNMPSWLVRLGFVTLFLFTGSFAVLLYVAGILMMAKRPTANRQNTHDRPHNGNRDAYRQQHAYHADTNETSHNLKDALFNYGPTPSGQAADIGERMRRIDEKLRRMEGYVTSRKFQFDREIKRS